VLRIAAYSLLGSRLLLAGVFLLAGVTKLFDRAGTGKALREFGLPAALAEPLAVLLPLAELAVVVILFAADLAWYGAAAALVLLTIFIVAMITAILRGRKPDCHCFGQLHSEPVGWSTLIRNVVLALVAVWILIEGRGAPGLDIWSWLAGLDGRKKLGVVAACIMSILFLRLMGRVSSESEATAVPEPVYAPTAETNHAETHPAHTTGIGLPVGTVAPDFELPDATGKKRNLASLLEGQDQILLVFLSPHCKPCQAVATNLPKWAREHERLPEIIIVSRGSTDDNLEKLKDTDPSRVLLQQNLETAAAYDCTSTPAAVLVGSDRLIRSQSAVGGVAIQQLLATCAKTQPTAI